MKSIVSNKKTRRKKIGLNTASPRLRVAASPCRSSGFSLLELIITLGVLAILVMGTIPLAQNAVKRQKEMRLRETLRDLRSAIDEFHRDTIGACSGGGQGNGSAVVNQFNNNLPADPRSRVVIDDCKIFDTLNLDRYPPSLDLLVQGVKIKSRGLGVKPKTAFEEPADTDEPKELNKVYLRELPVDPMTGEKDWKLRSSYQTKEQDSWDDINVFDVRSSSDEEALNGEKYSDW